MKKIMFIMISILFFAGSGVAGAADFPAKEVYSKYSPSVVVIKASRKSGGGSIGTGSIFNKDGLVLTNAHVIFNKEENKPFSRIMILIKPNVIVPSSSDQKEAYEAEVLKYDVSLDLALLKIKRFDHKVEPVQFADPGQIAVGEEVIAIGHPEMGGFWTLTYGRISGAVRDFQGVPGKEVFQTDTSVNRGNSGGPLLDRRGYMVAINSNIARLSKDGLPITGINFAIKSSVAKNWLEANGYKVAYGTMSLSDEGWTIKPEAVVGVPDLQSKKSEPEPEKNTRFETPIKPYNWDEFLKAAEKDLDEMMDEMRGKFRR